MKELDPLTEFVVLSHSVSVEAFRAQRMAELENLARYRAARLKDYQDWSIKEKREAKIAEAEAAQRFAREMVSGKPDEYAVSFDAADKKVEFKISPLIKVPPVQAKERLWDKVKRWIRRE